jgi:antitoxin component YwqK of YwqJK toxin-antitoxin module
MKTFLIIAFVMFFASVSLAETIYSNNIRDAWECNEKAAAVTGDGIFIYENGSIVEDGVCSRYDGRNLDKVPVKNGQKHGTELVYRENGSLLFHIDFENGILSGYVRTYNEDGSLRAEKIYIDGVRQN